MPSADDYTWIEDSLLGVAACLTVILGKSRESVLADFGADAQATVPIDEAYGSGVSVVDVPGGVLAIERNGFQGSRPEVLQALSASGSASSMFWNVNEHTEFTCARGGDLVARVDMMDAEDSDEVELPDDLRPLFELGADEDADLHAIGLAMVEQFTGVKIAASHIATVESAHPITNIQS